jgi:hypothetical protein
MAFFTLSESEKIGMMSGFRQRRGYRTDEKSNCNYIVFGIALCLMVTDLHAPEIEERDIFGYDAYRVAENGAILTKMAP